MSTTPPAAVTLTVEGVRVMSEANTRGHWATRHRRNRMQQDLVRVALLRLDRAGLLAAGRLRVTFSRVRGPRGQVMDSDGLCIAFKHVRDAVAGWLQRDDGDGWYDWRYDPEQVKGKEYGVRLTFTPLPAGDTTG